MIEDLIQKIDEMQEKSSEKITLIYEAETRTFIVKMNNKEIVLDDKHKVFNFINDWED